MSQIKYSVSASPSPERVGWGFIGLYTLAYLSTCLLFLAPLVVTLALKVNSLVGIEQAPNSLALVAGVGALLAIFANPFFGMLGNRTAPRFGMRRTWMIVGLGGGSCWRMARLKRPSRWCSSDGASRRCSSTR